MKITSDHVRKKISHSQYHRFKGTTVTVCCITLNNGHTVVGHSACADPDEFDINAGQEIAFQNAFDKVFELEAYMLSENLNNSRTSAQRLFNERSSIVSDRDAPHADFGAGEPDEQELEFPPLNIEIHEWSY